MTAYAQLVAGKQRAFKVVLSSVVQVAGEQDKLCIVVYHVRPDFSLQERIDRELPSDQPTTCPRMKTSSACWTQRSLSRAA